MATPPKRTSATAVVLAVAMHLACGDGGDGSGVPTVRTFVIRGATQRVLRSFGGRIEVEGSGGSATVRLVALVPETGAELFRDVDVMDRLFAVTPAAPGRELALEVEAVASRPDPASGGYRIIFRIPRPEGLGLERGMPAIVKAILPADVAQGAMLVPPGAVQPDGDGRGHVWVVSPEDRTVRRRPVWLAPLVGSDQLAIRKGVLPGERIVVSELAELREGMRVLPVE